MCGFRGSNTHRVERGNVNESVTEIKRKQQSGVDIYCLPFWKSPPHLTTTVSAFDPRAEDSSKRFSAITDGDMSRSCCTDLDSKPQRGSSYVQKRKEKKKQQKNL